MQKNMVFSSSLSFKCALRESGCRIGYKPTKNDLRSLSAVDIQGHQRGGFCSVPRIWWHRFSHGGLISRRRLHYLNLYCCFRCCHNVISAPYLVSIYSYGDLEDMTSGSHDPVSPSVGLKDDYELHGTG